MAKEFLQEAFKKLNILGEDVFNLDDDGIKDLKDFEKDSEEEVDTEVSVIDPEAETVEDLEDSYVGKVILECPVCHSFLFKDRAKIEINKVSDLANSDEECPYCCTVGGFNIIGQVEELSDENEKEEVEEETEDEVVDVEEVKDTEEDNVEDVEEEETEENEEEEEAVEEGFKRDCDGKNCDKEDEGILGTIARGISPLPVVGQLLGDSLENRVCEKCGKNPCECVNRQDESAVGALLGAAAVGGLAAGAGSAVGKKIVGEGQEEKDESLAGAALGAAAIGGLAAGAGSAIGKKIVGEGNEEKDEGLVGTALGAAALGGLAAGVGSGVTKKVLSGLDREECKKDGSCKEAIITDTVEANTSVTDVLNRELGIDSWTDCTYDDEDDTVPVEVFNGDEIIGKFFIRDGKLVSAEVKEEVNEDLTVTTNSADGSVEVSSTEDDKVVTVKDTDTAVEDVVTDINTEEQEEVEETGEEEVKDETIVPLTDEEKKDIEKDQSEEEEETEVDVNEIEEESFDRLSEKFLTNTYDNVESYRTVRAQTDDNILKLEGIIKFKSGKEKSTSFILEAKDITPSGKARFVGENQQISTAKKAFTVSGKLTEGKFIAESLNYNYNTKDTKGKSSKVYGTVSNKRK